MSDDTGAGTAAPAPLDPAQPTATSSDDDKLTGHILEAWKKTVDVQQHFNQIEMDIRKTAVTVIVAVIGAAGFASDRGMQFVLFGWHLNVAALIVLAGLVALGAFFWMDYFQYHRLLKGAVDHGMTLEKALSARGVPVDLTKTIGKFSAVVLFERDPPPDPSKPKPKPFTFRSDDKIKLFYQAIAIVLVAFVVAGSCGAPAAKSTPTTPPPQRLEIAPAGALQADVRIVSMPQAAAALPQAASPVAVPSIAPSTVAQRLAPVPATTPTPSALTPAQSQTGQAGP